MKGIILAGGTGTRLHPLTLAVSKQLMPIYDKPLIYYPLSTLMWAGIRDILIISTPHDLSSFEYLLGDGKKFGCNFEYAVQEAPNGLAELLQANNDPDGGIIYAYHVNDPERYGVAEFDSEGNVMSIEEKPEKPKSNFVVPGIYFYDNNVIKIAKSITRSPRGELEELIQPLIKSE